MSLPYIARLFCVLAVIAGAVHLLLQASLAAPARLLRPWLDRMSARCRERSLFWIQTGPILAALLFAGGFCLPQYVFNETNHAAENVSGGCVLLALAVVAWFAWPVAKALRMALRTLRFSRACRRIGTRLNAGACGIPILAVPEPGSLVALVGLVRPSILISRRLLDSGSLDAGALDAAFDHERAHAAQRDNWKLLALNLLPRLAVPLPRGETWLQLWQQAAEWAADDDAVAGDPERSLVLAETLVRVARLARNPGPPMLQTALCCGEAGLAARVSRLLAPAYPAPQIGLSITAVAWRVALAAAAVAVAVSPWVYSLSERILHLG